MIKRLLHVFFKERPFFFVVPAFLWQVLFFYVPLITMALLSIIVCAPMTEQCVVSLVRYIPFLTDTYFYIIFKSIILASVTGILCFLAGYPLAYFLAFKAGRLKIFFLFLLVLPFWTNFLLHVYAWFFLLDSRGLVNQLLLMIGLVNKPVIFLNTHVSIVMLMFYCYLPFMVLPIYAALDRFDIRLLEASQDLGASHLETWYHIVFPLSMTGVISGFFLVFVPSFGEFAIPGLMGGEKFLFVGSVIAQYALGGPTMPYSTAFTIISFGCLLVFIACAYLAKRVLFHLFVGEQ